MATGPIRRRRSRISIWRDWPDQSAAILLTALLTGRVHSVHRAATVGSVDAVIRPEELRPQIISALEARLS
jgi:acetyl-CoA carboxylase carboxyltransferase component